MNFITKLKTDRKFLLITVVLTIATFIIPYLIIPGLAIWWFFKKSRFSKKFKIVATTGICTLFALLIVFLYKKGTEPNLAITAPALTSNLQVQQNALPIQTTVPSPQPVIQAYQVLNITTEKDKNNQPYSMQIYALEIPVFKFDKTKITALISIIQKQTCLANVDPCNVDLYDNEHFAQESYAFDVAQNTSQAAIDQFDTQYPDFSNLDEHHLVAKLSAGKILFYPLLHTVDPTTAPTLSASQKKQVVTIVTNGTNYFKKIWRDGQSTLGTTQYGDANAGLYALQDPNSNASKFSQFKQSENPIGDTSIKIIEDTMNNAGAIYPDNVSSDAMSNWQADVTQLSQDMTKWVDDATGWQINTVKKSTLDTDAQKVEADFATVQQDIQAIN